MDKDKRRRRHSGLFSTLCRCYGDLGRQSKQTITKVLLVACLVGVIVWDSNRRQSERDELESVKAARERLKKRLQASLPEDRQLDVDTAPLSGKFSRDGAANSKYVNVDEDQNSSRDVDAERGNRHRKTDPHGVRDTAQPGHRDGRPDRPLKPAISSHGQSHHMEKSTVDSNPIHTTASHHKHHKQGEHHVKQDREHLAYPPHDPDLEASEQAEIAADRTQQETPRFNPKHKSGFQDAPRTHPSEGNTDSPLQEHTPAEDTDSESGLFSFMEDFQQPRHPVDYEALEKAAMHKKARNEAKGHRPQPFSLAVTKEDLETFKVVSLENQG